MLSGVVTERDKRGFCHSLGWPLNFCPRGSAAPRLEGQQDRTLFVSFSALKLLPPCFGFASYFNKGVNILTSASYFPGRGRCEKPYSDRMEIWPPHLIGAEGVPLGEGRNLSQ